MEFGSKIYKASWSHMESHNIDHVNQKSYQLKFFGLGALLRLPGTPNDCQNFGLKGTVNCP